MTAPQVSEDFRRKIAGFGLTTAEIWYRKPGATDIINPYPLIRQFDDMFPEFPELNKYLAWWQVHIKGPLHQVIVGHCRLIKRVELHAVNGEFRLH